VLVEILNGNRGVIPESKYIDIPPRAVTKENLDEYWDELRSLLAR
jgi:ribose transport system substrate-binding protein